MVNAVIQLLCSDDSALLITYEQSEYSKYANLVRYNAIGACLHCPVPYNSKAGSLSVLGGPCCD